jgi:regulator of protease activity HflC (stomatin/prohibitin superfamily)
MEMFLISHLATGQTTGGSGIPSWIGIVFAAVTIIIMLTNAVRFLKKDQRGVVIRSGKFHSVKGPGVCFIIPWTDRMTILTTQVSRMDLPVQELITRDNRSVKIDAVVYFRVVDAAKAFLEVGEYVESTSQAARTVIEDVLSQFELSELLSAGEELDSRLQIEINKQTEHWGVEITKVEVKSSF